MVNARYSHLPLRQDRRQFTPGRFSRLPSNLPQLQGTALEVYVALGHCANRHTQRAWPWQKTIAGRIGRSERTVRYAVRELRELGLLAVLKTRSGNVYTLLDPQNCLSQRNEIASPKKAEGDEPSTHTVANAPVCRREVPAPPRRPHRPFPRRFRCKTPIQQTAEKVMIALGIAPTLWRTREAIAHAVGQWARMNPGKGLNVAIAALVGAWKCYQAAGPLRYRWGMERFYGENFWTDDELWPWDFQAMRLRAEARVGSPTPPPAQIDFARLKARVDELMQAEGFSF